MCKSFIYETMLEAIVSETEISKELILSHNKHPDVVEARRLLCHYLHRAGFYPSQIARMMGQSRQCVNEYLHGFDIRCKYCGKILKIYMQKLDNVLSEYLLPTPHP